MKTYTVETLAKDIGNAFDWLVEKDCGCVTLKLDDRLAVCVGWSDGFDPDDETVIHGKPASFSIVAAIKVWTSDDMRTDLDWIAAPYYESGNVYDDEVPIGPNANFEFIAKSFLEDYEELKGLDIDKTGRIHNTKN